MDGLASPGEITAVKMSQASHDLHPMDCAPGRAVRGEEGGDTLTSVNGCRGMASKSEKAGGGREWVGGNERGGEKTTRRSLLSR